MRLIVTILIGALAFASPLSAQQQPAQDARYYRQQALAAFKEKNYPTALDHFQKADQLLANHPTIVYYLAITYTALGNHDAALQRLEHLAAMGLAYPLEKDAYLTPLKESQRFAAVLKRIEQNRAPVANSRPAFTIDQKGLVVESVAYDPQTETFYVSSVHQRKILAIDRQGSVKELATERDGLWSVLGIKVDAKRRHLWAVTSAMPQMRGLQSGDAGRSAVFKFALPSGKLIKAYHLPKSPTPHALGDLLINARGEVFASDSLTPAVYRIDARGDKLELFLEDAEFASPQGLAFSDDESEMFLADYSKGIFRIDMRSRRVSLIQPTATATLLGIDGLYFYRGDLLAIQNGVNPQRVVRIALARDRARATGFRVLEANHAAFDEPTLGVLVKDQFYFVANSQWGSVDEKGQLAPPEKLRNTLILKMDLRK